MNVCLFTVIKIESHLDLYLVLKDFVNIFVFLKSTTETLSTPRPRIFNIHNQFPLFHGIRVNATKVNAKQDTKLLKLSYEELIVTKVGITAV